MSKRIKTDIQIRKLKRLKAWQGKLLECTHASQKAPKLHFRSTIISHLEHNYSTPRFWARKTLNNSKLIVIRRRSSYSFVFLIFQTSNYTWATFYSNLSQIRTKPYDPKSLHYNVYFILRNSLKTI